MKHSFLIIKSLVVLAIIISISSCSDKKSGKPRLLVFTVVDSTNDATKQLPKQWKRTDEFYSFKKLSKEVKVLLTIDEKTYHGGANGGYHPMAWYHDYDGGRAFYTNLGHTKESFADT